MSEQENRRVKGNTAQVTENLVLNISSSKEEELISGCIACAVFILIHQYKRKYIKEEKWHVYKAGITRKISNLYLNEFNSQVSSNMTQ